MTAATRVLQRNLLVYRRTFRGSIFSSFVTPLLYLTAMGLGLGQLVTRDVSSLPGGDYLAFLGPGIMAATCMQSAVFESTFPIMGKIMWRRNYEAMLATPIEVRHILGGELLWIGFRMVLISSVFLVVLTLFRIPTSFLALLAVPAVRAAGRGVLGGDHQLRRHPAERRRLRRACSASSSTRSSCSAAPSSR